MDVGELAYTAAERNYEGVEWEEIRLRVDPPYNALHDSLSAAYYERRPFAWEGKDYGVLSKEQFDKLHGLCEHLRYLAWCEAAQQLPAAVAATFAGKQDAIRDRDGAVVGSRQQESAAFVETLRREGLEVSMRESEAG